MMMICYYCEKASDCPTLRTLHRISEDFSINECRDFDKASKYNYRKIANNDNLMRLIYDYFAGQIEGGYTEEQAKSVIRNALINMG